MSLELVDRAIYETIRLELVNQQLTPDIVNAVSPQDWTDITKVFVNKFNDNDFVLLDSVSSIEKRFEKRQNVIQISRERIDNGSFGIYPEQFFNKNINNTFTKSVGANPNIISYEIRSIAISIKYQRALNDIIINSLRSNRYITTNGLTFFVERIGIVDVSSTNFIETLYQYRVVDVYIEKDTILSENITTLVDINNDVNLL